MKHATTNARQPQSSQAGDAAQARESAPRAGDAAQSYESAPRTPTGRAPAPRTLDAAQAREPLPRPLRRARRLGAPHTPSAEELARALIRKRARRRHGRARLGVAALLFALALLPARAADGPALTPELFAELAAADEIERRLTAMNPHLGAARAARIREAILRSSARHGLDPLLVTAVIEVESNFRPEARSRLGALGLMQVMPHMFRVVRMAGNPATLESNIEAGCAILAGNIRRLGERDGISAYFWGSRIRGSGYFERVQAARARLESARRS